MPMNAPGGGPAPEEAYEIYSALYQAPMPEALAFAENSVTDIPRWTEAASSQPLPQNAP